MIIEKKKKLAKLLVIFSFIFTANPLKIVTFFICSITNSIYVWSELMHV